jgi:regulator of protease activity HflC (stomatin/prohibitin superfamily)
MGWVILTVIASLVVMGCFLTIAFAAGDDKFFGVIGIVITVILWGVISIFMSLHRLNTGQVGLVYSFSGKLTGSNDNAGVIWLAPWQHMRRASVQVQSESFELGQGNSAVSKDQQPIFAKLVLNYEIDPNHVVDLYKNVGPNWKAKLVESRVLQDFKEVTATYPTTQITASREQLRVDTRDRLRKELGPYSITVTDLFVSNIGFSQGYTDAIEAKQVQVQAAARAQAKVAQVKAEADQAVAEAEGQKNATIARAEGDAKANRLIASSVTDRLIELRRVEALKTANTIYVPSNWTAFGNLSGK